MTAELIESERMSYFSARFRIVDNRMVSIEYTFRIKNDPRRTLWKRSASGQIVDDSTILMTYPTIYLNKVGSLRAQGTKKSTYRRS